jgi:acyl carrier protein
MDRQEIRRALIEVLAEIQTETGETLVEIDEETRPIGELPGFDSLTAIEVTIELAHRLGLEIPYENIFVNAKGTRALRIREITERLYTTINTKVTSNDRASS